MPKIQLPFLISIGSLFLFISLLSNWNDYPTAEAAPLAAQPAAINAITCVNGYTASTYFSGLNSPDGLAMDSSGLLYVSEESTGQIRRINSTVSSTVVLSGLIKPEGIAFDSADNLYVVEDEADGRLIRLDTNGITTTLASNLLAPEGVVVGPDGTIYITESGLQVVNNLDPADYIDITAIDFNAIDITDIDLSAFQIFTDTFVSRVTAIAPEFPFTATTILTTTPEVTPTLSFVSAGFIGFTFNTVYDLEMDLDFLSLAGITMGSDGQLYVAAELSNMNIISSTTPNYTIDGYPVPGSSATVRNLTVETKSNRSILQLDPSTGISLTYVSNLTTTEESRFISSGQFPMYIVQEDVSGVAQQLHGRLDIITETNGSPSVFCDGFGTIEDVFVAPDGSIYVTEDQRPMGGGFGKIIKISSAACIAPPAPTNLAINHTSTISLTWQGDNSVYDFMLWESTSDPYLSPSGLACQFSNECQLVTTGNDYATAVVDKEFYIMSSIESCGATAAGTHRVGQFSFGLEPGN